MKNIKFGLLALSLLVLLGDNFSVPIKAMESSTNSETTLVDIRPMGAIYLERSVTKSYLKHDDIPSSIVYEEWSSIYQYYFRGTLYKSGNIRYDGVFYHVTYTGVIAGSGL